MSNKWPHLDYLSWRETCSALHLYLQIAGKYRLAHTPWLNHSWNATFYVTPNGLASSPIPDGPGIEILFDLRDHKVVGTCGDGRKASFALGPIDRRGVPRQFRAVDFRTRRHADLQRTTERGAQPGTLRRRSSRPAL